jgi:5S rRNA maturation endonuclease (ribonuclease M5)
MQWPHPIEAETHITSEFVRCGVDFHPSGPRNFKLNCPFPHEKGQDDGFHLEITKDGRKAHCWVCDWSGSWNKLARAMGMAEFNAKVFADTYTDRVAETDVFGKLQDEFNTLLNTDDNVVTLPEGLSPWEQPVWRGLSKKFLRRIPSFLWKQEVKTKTGRTFNVDRILWPYYQYDRLVGWVGRRLDKSDFQKYFRKPGCDAKKVLFPFDYVRQYHKGDESVVLVEGEVDALNLLQSGIPALAILGSNNWSDDKLDLLLSLNFKRVYLLMDPDFAGRKAAKEIRPTLDAKFEYTKVLRIDGDDDPGSLDEGQLSWLRDRVFQERS